MTEHSLTKIDLGDIDSTISNNSLASQENSTTQPRVYDDPVKPKPWTRGSRLVLLITAVALSSLLAGGIAAAIAIFEFDVFNTAPQRLDVFNSSYVDAAEDKLDDVSVKDPMNPKDFVFNVSIKAAGNAKAYEPVRLVNGNSPNEGRVEINYYGQWGTICDDLFDIAAAGVVCRQLGYEGALAYHPLAAFGQGSGLIWLDNVQCLGYETDLDYCSHNPWGSHDCSHNEDVGVTCIPNTPTDPTEVRLVDGHNANEGRVEVNHNGRWGTICDDSWTNEDAKVVCRQLGLPHENAIALSSAHFGEGVGDILLDEVNCNGNEENIGDCQHPAWGSHNCQHSEDASVECGSEVRLVGGYDANQGRVEVKHNGRWGTVCDDSWTNEDAKVVCRQLGLPHENAIALSSAHFGEGVGDILLDEVNCYGNEEKIGDCQHQAWGSHNCQHSEDASVICSDDSEGEVRLVGGVTPNEGRVEILRNGIWGTVCDDSWDNLDANVVCRQLGYAGTGHVSYGSSHFGQGSGPILMDEVSCLGSETSLAQCVFGGWSQHNCQHSEDAGVICSDDSEGDVRLVGGVTPNEGRVEILHNGIWGTVCDDSWDNLDANVVCRQLGYAGTGHVSYGSSHFGQGSGPILMDDVSCLGSETSLAQCVFGGWNQHNCQHSEDAGVICSDDSEGEVRLVGGATPNEGRVEILRNGIWGTVCDDSWDNLDANVVCRQLGYAGTGHVSYGSSHFGQGSGPILMDEVSCLGSETSLAQCVFGGWNQHNCQHSEDAGVICSDDSEGEVRLVGGVTPNEGRVEILHNGIWGTVCDDSWDNLDANVVCRQLGYAGTGHVSHGSSHFGQGSGPILMDEVSCLGSETSLAQCVFGGWNQHNCQHSEDAGVICSDDSEGDVRLVGGVTPNEGRVEILHNGIWGTVCDDSWDNLDANVVCRQLGYAGTGHVSYGSSHFGQGSGPILMDEVSCLGSETSLTQCVFGGWNQHNCQHSEDAGVICSDVGPWEELAQQCGRPNMNYNNRIVSGDDVTDIRTWPWAGYITNDDGDFCGAELISKNWAITAAHCVDQTLSTTYITLGKLYRSQNILGITRTTPVRVFSHPDHNSGIIHNNDIALLKLNTPVQEFNDYVRPVCMATTDNEIGEYDMASCHVIGWGALYQGGNQPDILQEVVSPLLTEATCRGAYGRDAFGTERITDKMICTSTSPNPGQANSGSCQGDSGGPMACRHSQNGLWDLVGVTSWGVGCAVPGYPDVMARVSQFQRWIHDTIDANGGP